MAKELLFTLCHIRAKIPVDLILLVLVCVPGESNYPAHLGYLISSSFSFLKTD